MDPRVIQLLQRTQAVVIDGWSQGGYGRDARGHIVHYSDPNAVSYCLLGAIYHCAQNQDGYHVEKDAIDLLARQAQRLNPDKSWFSLMSFNDDAITTKQDILTVIQSAIDECKACETNS